MEFVVGIKQGKQCVYYVNLGIFVKHQVINSAQQINVDPLVIDILGVVINVALLDHINFLNVIQKHVVLINTPMYVIV